MNEQSARRMPDASDGSPLFTGLNDVRVVELGDGVGYGGRLLAMQGADVILAEPPEGFASRRRPPFLDDVEDVERSLTFHYINAGKRSVVIDRDNAEDRARLRRLLLSADVVLDDRLQEEWRPRGLDYEALQRENAGLIWCSVTPFGQTGPRARHKGDDFICMAAGGMTQLAGYEDLGPYASPGDIAVKSAGAYAAVATMLALHARDRDGAGQFIDLSVQEVVALGTETAPQFFDIKRTIRRRLAQPQRQAGIGYYPCADGYVMLYAAEAGVGTGWTRLVDWMVEAGTPGAERLQGEEWLTNSYKARRESADFFATVFDAFARPRTKRELFEGGQRRRIAITPVNTGADVCADRHLNAVGGFGAISHVGGRAIIGPAAPVVMSATQFKLKMGAPLLGEHTSAILCSEEADA